MNNSKCKLDKGRGKKDPLYKQVSDQLAAQIESGKFGAGDRLPSVSKLVKQWDVNYQTINLALARLEEQGLIRCASGRGKGPLVLVGSAQKFKMMFLRWSNDGYPMEICEGIRKFAEEKKVRFSIAHHAPSRGSVADIISNLPAGDTGLIMLPMDTPEFENACHLAVERGVKMILVDERLEDLPVNTLSIDHAGGAHRATMHLLKGHGGPVLCFGATLRASVQERVAGWCGAMNNYGITDHEKYLYTCPELDPLAEAPGAQALSQSYEAAKAMLNAYSERPLSVLTCTGYAAQGLYKAAGELNLEIGKDIFVAGFGDDAFCHKLPVPLTNIKQDWDMLGQEAASILLAEMSGVIRHTMHHLLPAKLQIHASSVAVA